jgi:hypothetical protein
MHYVGILANISNQDETKLGLNSKAMRRIDNDGRVGWMKSHLIICAITGCSTLHFLIYFSYQFSYLCSPYSLRKISMGSKDSRISDGCFSYL